METTIQPFWMYFEMKNYHQSWCFQYIYLYKLRKLSFFHKVPWKDHFPDQKKPRRRTLIPALPHHQLVASMNWNITTGTNACQTHTHTKNFHILHMPTLAPSYSRSPFAGTRTQWVRFWLVWSPGLSPRPWTVFYVTAAAKQFRPLDVCWYRFHTTNIAHLCLNVYVLVARKHPRTQTHTQSFVRASHKRQLMASMWRVNMCVFVGKVSLGVPWQFTTVGGFL